MQSMAPSVKMSEWLPVVGVRCPRCSRPARHCADLADVAVAVCDAVRTQVPYIFGCLATTDPSTGLISWTYKTHPLEVGDEEFAVAEYGGRDVNQFLEIGTRSDPVGVLSLDTGGDLDSCRRFRYFLAPRFGFSDELRVVFRARGLTWGALALYRGGGEPAFTADEAQAAVSVHAQIAEVIQSALFHPQRSTPGPATGPSVIVVDSNDRVTNMTPAAHARIEELGGWDDGSLPAPVLVTTAAVRTTPELATNRAVGRDARGSSCEPLPLPRPPPPARPRLAMTSLSLSTSPPRRTSARSPWLPTA